ncbi:MAG: class I SAM-dependent methyltransferase [Anaerolineales bacterium]
MDMEFVLLIVGLTLLLILGLWILVPSFYGLPWVPTREKRIRKALQLANLQSGETLYDLGAGDGRILLVAAKEFGAQAVGIEIGPVQCLLGWLKIWLSGNRRRVRMRCGDFFNSDISAADVVFVYATSSQTSRLPPLLERQLKPGARVVSVAADFPDWQPTIVDRELLIFVYEMPPKRVIESVPFSSDEWE